MCASIRRPLLWCGLTAVAVTAVALGCAWWVALLGVLLLVLFFSLYRMALCAVVAVVFLLISLGYRHTYVTATAALDGHTDTLTGVVVEESSRYGHMYRIRVTDSRRLRSGTQVMLLCKGKEKPALHCVVEADVRLYPLMEGQARYAAQGAFVCAFPAEDGDEDIRITGEQTTLVSRLLYRCRTALVSVPRRVLPGRESGVLTAMSFGEQTFTDPRITDDFRISGLSHLLVVSGLHVSLVAAALCAVLRSLGRRVSYLVTAVGVWVFALLVGLSPSVCRAAVMCTVWLLGNWLFQRADGINSLGLAAVIVLAVNPYALWSAGFQLSFAATLGVLTLTPRLMPHYEAEYDIPWWRRGFCWLRQTLVGGAAVCLSALLFTLPIAIYHYGGTSLTALVANALAVPVAGAALLLCWIGTLCGLVPFLGWLAQGVLLVAGLLARYMLWVARLCAPDGAWLTLPYRWQWLLVAGACLLAAYGIRCRVSRRRLVGGLTALAVLALCVGIPLTATPWQLTVVPSDNESGFILRQGRHCALLLTDAGELNEVVYAAAPFVPDVVVVGDGSATALPSFDRFPQATMVVVGDAPWAGGVEQPTGRCAVGDTVTLWDGCRLTVVTTAWWRLQTDGQTIWIGTDPSAPCPDKDGFCIYVGGTPAAPPPSPYAAVCSAAWLRRHRPTLTGRETVIVEEPITFTPHRGEWRVLPWQ